MSDGAPLYEPRETWLRESFRGFGPDRDEEVAEAVHKIAERARVNGDPVALREFLEAIPWLRESDVAIDAAIEEALRVPANGDTAQVAVDLAVDHPELSAKIQRAVILGALLGSGGTASRSARLSVVETLPCEFGPPDHDGRARYELRSLLGIGCQGTVYTAVDRLFSVPESPNLVAIKIGHTCATESTRRAVSSEAIRSRRIVHSGVVRAIDHGIDEFGHIYAAFELVDGLSLDTWIKGRSSRISVREAVSLVIDLCEAVQAAHSVGLVHRDLKPSNILVDRWGKPKVTDFGVAREVALPLDAGFTYSSRGSLAFMAPEQYRSEPGSDAPVADVYALGGILHWLLANEYPNGSTATEAIERLERSDPFAQVQGMRQVRPDVSDALVRIVERALDPQPVERHGSAQALRDDLLAWRERRPIPWQDPPYAKRSWLFVSRHPWSSIATAGTLIAVTSLTMGIVQARASARLEKAGLVAQLEQEKLQGQLAEAAERVRGQQQLIKESRERISAWLSVIRTSGLIDPGEYIAIIGSISKNSVFEDASVADLVLDDRIGAARQAIGVLEARGHEKSLEASLWRGLLGGWLLEDGRREEATMELQQAEESLGELLRDDDPWLAKIRSLLAAASES